MRFPDGPLVNEGKFCLFFERVIEPYRVAPPPASKKRKRGPNEAAMIYPDGGGGRGGRGVGLRHGYPARGTRSHAGRTRTTTGTGTEDDDCDEDDAAGAPISTSTQRWRLLPDAARCAVGALLHPPGPELADLPRDGRAQLLRCGRAKDDAGLDVTG
jgi:hypothetical protein